MADVVDASTLETMAEDECLELLRQHSIGRVAVALPGLAPLVVPVNYLVDDGVIVFRSGDGEKITTLRQEPASFEIDEFDVGHRSGWSVLVKGVAYEAEPREVEGLDLEPWVPAGKHHWIRLIPSTISGRRIRLAPFEPDARAYL